MLHRSLYYKHEVEIGLSMFSLVINGIMLLAVIRHWRTLIQMGLDMLYYAFLLCCIGAYIGMAIATQDFKVGMIFVMFMIAAIVFNFVLAHLLCKYLEQLSPTLQYNNLLS
uniref:Uncharacterized protein n=1 Tax=Tetranychus urticae TaxID=32264 RepID=T1JY02_TETUR